MTPYEVNLELKKRKTPHCKDCNWLKGSIMCSHFPDCIERQKIKQEANNEQN